MSLLPEPSETNTTQHGFTLVELLVVMAIGALLLTAIVTSFSAILQTQSRVQAYDDLQDTLRFTTALMTRSLRSADRVLEATPSRLVIQRSTERNTRDCLGHEVAPDDEVLEWEETFERSGNRLVCSVEGEHLNNGVETEILAYAVSELNFSCAPYNTAGQTPLDSFNADYVPCSDFSDEEERIIAVRARLRINFLDQEEFTHHFTVTLRRHLNACLAPDDPDDADPDCFVQD